MWDPSYGDFYTCSFQHLETSYGVFTVCSESHGPKKTFVSKRSEEDYVVAGHGHSNKPTKGE